MPWVIPGKYIKGLKKKKIKEITFCWKVSVTCYRGYRVLLPVFISPWESLAGSVTNRKAALQPQCSIGCIFKKKKSTSFSFFISKATLQKMLVLHQNRKALVAMCKPECGVGKHQQAQGHSLQGPLLIKEAQLAIPKIRTTTHNIPRWSQSPQTRAQ